MQKFFLIFFLVALSFEVKAQLKKIDNSGRYPADLIIKIAPLSLIDIKQSFQIAVEYKVKPRLTFQNEVGYINNNVFNLYPDEDFMNLRGFRTRFESRFYQKNFLDEVNGFYLAPEIFFVHTNYQRASELGRGCTGWNCDYFERIKYSVIKNVVGYHFKFGYQRVSYGRVLLDIYGGFGLRHVFMHTPGVELEQDSLREPSDLFPSGFGTFNRGKFTRYSMSLGLKVGYLIK